MVETHNTLGVWAEHEAHELFAKVNLVREHVGVTEAWKALQYARTGSEAYDDLAYRLSAASPCRNHFPLQSIPRMLERRERDRQAKHSATKIPDPTCLTPRALDCPKDIVDGRYEFTRDELRFYVKRQSAAEVQYEERWTVGRSHPPTMMLRGVEERDAHQMPNQLYSVSIPHAAWVSLETLVSVGKFHRRQAWEDSLVKRVDRGRLYLFVSHRWRWREHPDPDGTEACLIAWQLIDHLVEAVLIAWRRGLRVPRKYSPTFAHFIGLVGRELAEALIVNVLRPNLDEMSLMRAADEAVRLERSVGERTLETAQRDLGLDSLRTILEASPELRRLTGCICLWYDFASIPQPPRAKREEEMFREALDKLSVIQSIGRLVVLIDTPEKYLARAWCTLEVTSANVLNGAIDLLHADARPTAINANMETYFGEIMNDRPHIVRRAVLDTVLFQVQSQARCFERLGIALNHQEDLPIVFRLLRDLSHTWSVHVDSSCIVTGALPLAPRRDGTVVLPSKTIPREFIADSDGTPLSFDGYNAMQLRGVETISDAVYSAHETLTTDAGKLRCHVIAVAACEGDAILVARWLRSELSNLENVIGAQVVALSWLSEDIAPIGEMPCGGLFPVIVPADMWLLVGPGSLLAHGAVGPRLIAAATEAGLERMVLVLDASKHNLFRMPQRAASAADRSAAVSAEHVNLRPIVGGVFAAAIERPEARLFLLPEVKPSPLPVLDRRPPPEQLQVIVLNAVFNSDRALLVQYCQDYAGSIHQHFKSWMSLPSNVIGNPQYEQLYVRAIVTLAKTLQALGYPGPLETLSGGAENPIERFHRTFAEADRYADEGELSTSVEILTELLAELGEVRGTIVGELKPKVMGRLAAALYVQGQADEAKSMMRGALTACQEFGDEEGISTYRQNLALMEAAALHCTGGPLREIAAAQQLSDRGRYEASNLVLETLPCEPTDLWACKIQGLFGLNYYFMGNRGAAATHMRRAMELSRDLGDEESYRVYRYNCSKIEEGAAALESA